MKVTAQSYSIRWYGRNYKVDAENKSIEQVVDEFNNLLKRTKVKVQVEPQGKLIKNQNLIQIVFK